MFEGCHSNHRLLVESLKAEDSNERYGLLPGARGETAETGGHSISRAGQEERSEGEAPHPPTPILTTNQHSTVIMRTFSKLWKHLSKKIKDKQRRVCAE